MENNPELPEPFATVFDLLREHGLPAVFDALAKYCQFREERSAGCQRSAGKYESTSFVLVGLAELWADKADDVSLPA